MPLMGEVLNQVRDAIRRRLPMSFQYIKESKTRGRRVGHPHVLFVAPSGQTSCLVLQTEGATDSEQSLPSWRQFELRFFVDVTVLDGQGPFPIRADFQKEHDRYRETIEAVAL